MFSAFLASIALWLTSYSPPYVVQPQWRIEKAWEKEGELYVFQASSHQVIEDCRKNPTHFLELPNVLALSHRVSIGERVIKGGNSTYFKSMFNGHWISCKWINGKRLVWQVKSPSKYFASISKYPVVTRDRAWIEFINQTLHVGTSFSLVLLSLFSLLVFLQKIDVRTVLALGLSGPFLFVYVAFMNCDRYHIYWHYLVSQQVAFIALWIGLALYFYCCMKRSLLHPKVFRGLIGATAINTTLLALTGNFDRAIFVSFLHYPFLVACVFNMLYRFFASHFSPVRKTRYLQGFCIIVYGLVIGHEVFLPVARSDLLLFGIGMCCGFAYLFMSVNEDIMQTYRDKAALYKKLNDEQEKLFALQSKEAIYHSIVSTSQMVAHDMRRPFTFMMGILALVKKAQTPEQIKSLFAKYGEAVDQSINAVQDMIKDILSFGVKQNLTLAPVSPNELVYYSLNAIKAWKDIKDITFSFDMQHEHKINADSLHLKRVIQNIVSNAVKAMQGTGHIVFASRDEFDEQGQEVFVLAIQNDGDLIPPTLIDNIFEPFVTGDTKKGRGLGLTICRNIVAEHGGQIVCRSNQEEGTTFFIRVPRLATPDTFSKQSLQPLTVSLASRADEEETAGISSDDIIQKLDEVERRGRKLRVLAIDDERVYLSLIDNYLATHQDIRDRIDLVVLQDYAPVLEGDAIHSFDLVILDVELKKELNGFELLTRWRERGYQGKVCMHSNWGGFGSAELARRAQADLYIPKPLSQEQLLHIIADVGDELLAENSGPTQNGTAEPVLPYSRPALTICPQP